MLSIENVSFSYGKEKILENINIEFQSGLYAFLAPNGAGKTTLLKILALLLKPSSGVVTYNGNDILVMQNDYRNLIGYLPQEVGYYKNYRVAEFLKYVSVIKGIEKNIANERIANLSKLFGVDMFINKKMGKLSGGMLQRVGIISALLNDPKILLLDEPSSGLDPLERSNLKKVLVKLSREKTVILSTHITSDVELIANEIIMIKEHKIMHKDTFSNTLALLHNKVFETTIEYHELEEYSNTYQIISQQASDSSLIIRFISKNYFDEKWRKCQPTLNDVYLSQYEER